MNFRRVISVESTFRRFRVVLHFRLGRFEGESKRSSRVSNLRFSLHRERTFALGCDIVSVDQNAFFAC